MAAQAKELTIHSKGLQWAHKRLKKQALTELTFIEVQCGNPLIEEDIERFEYKWKVYPESIEGK